MPTKHRRHAITETPRVKEALDALRGELDGERPDLAELVILGSETKLAQVRMERQGRNAQLTSLADKIRRRELDLDPALADEAKRSWIRGWDTGS